MRRADISPSAHDRDLTTPTSVFLMTMGKGNTIYSFRNVRRPLISVCRLAHLFIPRDSPAILSRPDRRKIFQLTRNHKNTSTFISSALVGNGSSNFCSTLGCRMPKVPMRFAFPPTLR